MPRPEYVTCIRKEPRPKTDTLCGRKAVFEFMFESVEHARLNEEKGGWLEACKKCLQRGK